MKKWHAIIVLLLMLLIAGCSEKQVVDKEEIHNKNDSQKSVTNVSEQTKPTVNEDKKQIEKPKSTKKEVSWDGTWVYLSDENLGQLDINLISENKVSYKMIGSIINPVNGNSYGNGFEGTGIIKEDKIEFTDDLVESCGGVMEKKENIITVKFSDENCNTAAVILDGRYKKNNTISKPNTLEYKDGKFIILGMSLGDYPSIAKEELGNPEYEGPSEDGFDYWVQKYPDEDPYIGYNIDNKLETIYTNASVDELTDFATSFNGDHYVDEDGSNYLYSPDTKQLLIYTDKGGETVRFFVTFADGNFYASIKNGWFKKIK